MEELTFIEKAMMSILGLMALVFFGYLIWNIREYRRIQSTYKQEITEIEKVDKQLDELKEQSQHFWEELKSAVLSQQPVQWDEWIEKAQKIDDAQKALPDYLQGYPIRTHVESVLFIRSGSGT